MQKLQSDAPHEREGRPGAYNFNGRTLQTPIWHVQRKIQHDLVGVVPVFTPEAARPSQQVVQHAMPVVCHIRPSLFLRTRPPKAGCGNVYRARLLRT